MFLVDAMARNSGIDRRFFHHEQSAAFAAESYARAHSKPAACLVTIGPGVANAVAGAFSCYTNSVPCLFISGAKRSNIRTHYKKNRFTFPQDADTVNLVRAVVKRVIEIGRDDDVQKIVDEAIRIAVSGRPGPVWLSVPLDVQGMVAAEVPAAAVHRRTPRRVDVSDDVGAFLGRLRKPLFMIGRGAEPVMRSDPYRAFLADAGLPFVTSIGSNHTIAAAGANGLGFFGPTGRRAANQVLHEADGLVVIGAGLDIDSTGFDRARFFKGKSVLAINADPNLDVSADCADFKRITADTRTLDFEKLRNRLEALHGRFGPWRAFVKQMTTLLPVDWEVGANLGPAAVDPYLFSLTLSRMLPTKVGISGGISLDVLTFSHAATLIPGQDFYISSHCGQLGWDIPAAIGLCDSGLYERVVCITGDGSAMFNLQELATLAACRVDVTLYIFDNLGYNSIRTSQDMHLDGRRVGSDISGLAFPQWSSVAETFGFDFCEIPDNSRLEELIPKTLMPGKRLVRVSIDPERSRTPRLVSRIADGKFQSPGLDDQFPFLSGELESSLQEMKTQLARDVSNVDA